MLTDTITDRQRAPDHYHHDSRPIRRFAVVSSECVESVHQGRGLTLDRVLVLEAFAQDDPDTNLGDGPAYGFDLAVFEECGDGPRLVAVIHRREGKAPTVTELDGPDDGRPLFNPTPPQP